MNPPQISIEDHDFTYGSQFAAVDTTQFLHQPQSIRKEPTLLLFANIISLVHVFFWGWVPTVVGDLSLLNLIALKPPLHGIKANSKSESPDRT